MPCKVFPALVIPRASEVRAAHPEVRLAPLDSSAHVQHPDTGLGAPVVGEETQVLRVERLMPPQYRGEPRYDEFKN